MYKQQIQPKTVNTMSPFALYAAESSTDTFLCT